jgi:ABC-type uncharacterized transport system permease subunit
MTVAAALALVLYSFASWRLGSQLHVGARGHRSGHSHGHSRAWQGIAFGLLALLSHAAAHLLAWQAAGGLDLHFYSALSLVALGMAVLSSMVAWSRSFEALGSVVYPLAALSLLVYAIAGVRPATGLAWQLQVHALLALLAYASLAVAAVLSIMLWWQERALRRRQLDNPLLRLLPPLTELEDLLFRTITAGFLLLTVALLTGVVFVENLFAQHLVHKTVLSLLSWLVFGALLYGRFRHGWRGRRAVRMTLWAMGLLVLAFFGSKFVLELLLVRGG